MSTPEMNPAPSSAAPVPARRFRVWLMAGAAGVLATLAACAPGHHHGGPSMGMHGQMDPESMARRVDKAVDWVLSDVQASTEQKQKVSALARQAITDFAPLRDKHRAARQSALKLMAAPNLDRPAMEALRVEQMQLADQASRRFTQALGDIAEVLTPEQRLRLTEKIEKRAGRRWS